MVLTAYNLEQKAIGLQKYIDVYGIKLLNKISQAKHNLNFDKLPSTQLDNLKTYLAKPYYETFILANKRYPTDFEARSLAHEFSPGRLKMLEVQKGLLADLKFGPINTNASKLAKKYKVSVSELKHEASNLEKNIWRKRMGANPNSVKQYPLKWMVDQGDDFDNVLKNLYKGKIVSYQRDKTRDLFYDAFGRKNLEGSNIKNPTYDKPRWEAMRRNWTEYNLIRNNINKKYPEIVLELDHPLAKSTLRTYFNATPDQLTRVNPMTKQLNRGFKKVLDERYRNAIKIKDYSKIKALNKIAKDLNINFAKVSKDFTKFDYGVKPFEKLNMREAVADALTQQRNLSTELPKYTRANPELFLKAGIDLEKISTEVPKFNIANKEFNTLIQAIKKSPQACRKILNYQTGGISATCEIAINKDPVGSAKKLSNLEATSGPVATVKNAARGFLGTLGKFGAKAAPLAGLAVAGAAIEPLVKQFVIDDPTTYLTDESQMKGMLLATIEGETPKVDDEILKWQMPALGAATAAGAIPGAGEAYKARRGLPPTKSFVGPMEKGVGPVRSALGIKGVLGKALGATFSPLAVAATLPMDIAAQRKGGTEWGDIATDPLHWMGPAFASSGAELASKGIKNPTLLKALRLGISPRALSMVSRRFGLPGLAISAGMWGYDKWKNRSINDE